MFYKLLISPAYPNTQHTNMKFKVRYYTVKKKKDIWNHDMHLCTWASVPDKANAELEHLFSARIRHGMICCPFKDSPGPKYFPRGSRRAQLKWFLQLNLANSILQLFDLTNDKIIVICLRSENMKVYWIKTWNNWKAFAFSFIDFSELLHFLVVRKKE